MSSFTPNPGAIEELLNGPDSPIARDLLQKAIQVENVAKRLCPVRTGRLRSSITHDVGRDAQGVVARVGTVVEYAIFIELGTRKMRAQPFLRPALKSVVG